MIKIIDHRNMGKSDRGWLHSTFHFSFAEYYNPDNVKFGNLRVVNDDIFDAGNGFGTHPHQNMEIISYVVDGELTHKDSMGNERTLTKGQVQYMSAGTGVTHSEFNFTDKPLRFLQIWILPDKNGYIPQYGDYNYNWSDRENQWLNIVSGENDEAPVKIHQDIKISVVSLDEGNKINYKLLEGRQAYIILIEGKGSLNNYNMMAKDAAEVIDEDIYLFAEEKAHYILFDIKK